MSHPSQIEFVRSVMARHPDKFVGVSVLEVGSLNINGSIRQFFFDCDYLGVDIGPGSCVDLVARGEDLDFPDGHFDTTASCECFEHNPNWKETFLNMVRMTRPGGLVFFSCATTGRAEHGTTRTSPIDAPYCGDYYRNLTREDFEPLCKDFAEYEFSEAHPPHDLYFRGIKNVLS